MKRTLLTASLLATLGLAAVPAMAQVAAQTPANPAPGPAAAANAAPTTPAAKPVRLHGTIAAVAKDHVDFLSRGGTASTLALMPNTRYVTVTQTTLKQIKAGDFVGVGAMEEADGSLKAMEVTVFPESMRGTGEGNRPWEQPKSEMTNGTVGKVSGKSAKSMTVSYKGGEKTINIPSNIPIVRLTAGTTAILKKGANVSVNAVKTGDTSYNALSFNVGGIGKKGLVPPT